MSEEKNKRKVERQSWKPHWAFSTLGKLWSVLFAAMKIAAGALATVLIICVICGVVFVGLLGDYLQDDIVPMAGVDLDGFDLDQNSFVYYVNSEGKIELLQALHATNKSVWAELEEIPEDLINATIAIEDKRFYEHQGVDWITTIKACTRMFFGNDSKGGSTITQQLIKNLFDEKDVTVQRKVLEIFRATEFEKRYDKDVVLEWYFNKIYMGNRCTGVKTAAETYFGKEIQALTTAECASLISITNNPSLYNPYRTNLDNGGMNGQERNRVRQLHVLEQMLEQGMITEEKYNEAVAQELVFKRGIAAEDRWATCKNEGCGYAGTVATFTKKGSEYYCPKCSNVVDISGDASQEVYSYFVDTVVEDVARALAERDGVVWNDKTQETYKNLIQSSGYHIYSTLDMDVQNQLDKIYQDLKQIPKPSGGQQMQSAAVIIDNTTGDIVALQGGVGKDKVHDGFNRATDAKLQTGSSGKPLMVYAPAFETGGITPATVIKDMPVNYNTSDKSGWPKNDDRTYRYSRTVYSGIVRSVNAVAANTLQKIGTGYAYKFAKEQFGISGLVEKFTDPQTGEIKSDVALAPLALGAQTQGVSVRDMASGFATFANGGTWREGRTFTKVYDSDGNLVLDNTQTSNTILKSKSLNYINYCLGDAVARGTGTEARISGQAVYGKTGTTSSNRDRWFCGYTKYYTAAVWCGYDQPAQIIISGNPAAQLFKKFMQPLHNGKSYAGLLNTTGMINVEICLDSGKLATEACKADCRTSTTFSRVEKVLVYREDAPKVSCDKHIMVNYCTEGKAAANSYCQHFKVDGKSVVEKKALLKLTQADIDELLKAQKYGLEAPYLLDSYVYLVDKSGKDASFKGFKKDQNKNADSPYVICTVHTKEAADELLGTDEPDEGGTGGTSFWPSIGR